MRSWSLSSPRQMVSLLKIRGWLQTSVDWPMHEQHRPSDTADTAGPMREGDRRAGPATHALRAPSFHVDCPRKGTFPTGRHSGSQEKKINHGEVRRSQRDQPRRHLVPGALSPAGSAMAGPWLPWPCPECGKKSCNRNS